MGTTTKLSLYIPTDGERNWGQAPGKVNDNFQKIDDDWDKHDHLTERNNGHGVVVSSKLETDVADLNAALGDNMKTLMMVFG